MNKEKALRAGVRVLVALAACSALYGQGFGTLVGTVTDPSGAIVPNAKITVTDETTAASRATKTNDQGYYVVPSLRPSSYSLAVEAQGFAPSTTKGIRLQADESATVNQIVSVQQATQTVEVTAQTAQVNTSTATVSDVVDQR